MDLDLVRDIALPGATGKIVLLVADGLGGLPHPETGLTEMETANTPNLDALAQNSMCGLTIPVAPGVTPGSGPGHLGLFGYDPVRYNIGRGVLEAVGIDFDLQPSDVAARGNFCTVDADGKITDRRAGRIATEVSSELIDRLSSISLPGVEFILEPVREHRFVLVLRGEGLSEAVSETDPQKLGVPPLPVLPTRPDPQSEATSRLLNAWIENAGELLRDEWRLPHDRLTYLRQRGAECPSPQTSPSSTGTAPLSSATCTPRWTRPPHTIRCSPSIR